MELVLACTLLVFIAAPSPGAQRQPIPYSITVQADAIPLDRDKPERRRFGKLEWLGTLHLSSQAEQFGGYSAIAIDGNGDSMLALSDEGTWLRAKIDYRDGHPEKILMALVGTLTGLGGKPLDGKTERDSEGFAFDKPGALTGKAFISFERKHRIAQHTVTTHGIGPAQRYLKLPPKVRSVKGNRGIEGITRLRGGPSSGSLLAFAEEYFDGDGDHVGWLIGGPRPGELALKRRGGFAITDIAGLANGDVVVLERRFRYSEGVKMRLRRVKAADIRPGAKLDGEVLFKADQLLEIDNVEGLGVHTDAAGRVVLTLISDDNFNHTFQRTLLMQFAIVE